jgi:hypothetical protein
VVVGEGHPLAAAPLALIATQPLHLPTTCQYAIDCVQVRRYLDLHRLLCLHCRTGVLVCLRVLVYFEYLECLIGVRTTMCCSTHTMPPKQLVWRIPPIQTVGEASRDGWSFAPRRFCCLLWPCVQRIIVNRLPAAAATLRGVLKDVACSLAIAHCTPQQQVRGEPLWRAAPPSSSQPPPVRSHGLS